VAVVDLRRQAVVQLIKATGGIVLRKGKELTYFARIKKKRRLGDGIVGQRNSIAGKSAQRRDVREICANRRPRRILGTSERLWLCRPGLRSSSRTSVRYAVAGRAAESLNRAGAHDQALLDHSGRTLRRNGPGARELFSFAAESRWPEKMPALIYVTHHIEEILPLFGKTLVLRKERVLYTGRTKQVLNPQMRRIRFFGSEKRRYWAVVK
jgi:hypothetical protein